MITQNSAIETIYLAIFSTLRWQTQSLLLQRGETKNIFFTLTMISLGAHKTVEVKGSKLKDVHLNGQAKAHFSNFALPPHA